MKKIFSNVEPNLLLHIINRFNEIENRTDVIPENNFIQCATLKLSKGTTFKPHKHIKKQRCYDEKISQESWVVIRGKVKCILYDIDDSIISEEILNPGDASFTLYGGHTYEILEEDSIIYEYKTGPYEGQLLDKQFINE